MHLRRVGFGGQIGRAAFGEGVGEVAGTAADVEHGGARQPAGVHRVRHHRGVGGDRAVEPGRIGLLEPEVVEQTGGAAQRRIAGEG